MGQHSVPRGEKSTAGASNGSPGTPGYQPRHADNTYEPHNNDATRRAPWFFRGARDGRSRGSE